MTEVRECWTVEISKHQVFLKLEKSFCNLFSLQNLVYSRACFHIELNSLNPRQEVAPSRTMMPPLSTWSRCVGQNWVIPRNQNELSVIYHVSYIHQIWWQSDKSWEKYRSIQSPSNYATIFSLTLYQVYLHASFWSSHSLLMPSMANCQGTPPITSQSSSSCTFWADGWPLRISWDLVVSWIQNHRHVWYIIEM